MRLASVVAEGAANFADRGVDALVNVDENILAPERRGDLLAGYELPFIFDQKHQELERKAFEAQRLALAEELKAREIELKSSKQNFLSGTAEPRPLRPM